MTFSFCRCGFHFLIFASHPYARVVGNRGSGKTTVSSCCAFEPNLFILVSWLSVQFINTAAKMPHLRVDDKLSGSTRKISAIRFTVNREGLSHRIVLVDTVPSDSKSFIDDIKEWVRQQWDWWLLLCDPYINSWQHIPFRRRPVRNSPRISTIIYLESILTKRRDPKNRPEIHVERLMAIYRHAQPKLVTTMWRFPSRNQVEANYETVWDDLENGWKAKFPNNDIVDYKMESPQTVWSILESVLPARD